MNGIKLINAGAGTGKTFHLVGEALSALDTGLPADGLLITTFTHRAATDIRQRLRRALFASGKTDAAQAVLGGLVGTVNSVCHRLLCEYAMEAGLSPRLQVLDEQESSDLFRIATAEALEQHAVRLEPVARRLERDGGGSGHARRPDWRDDVMAVVSLARSNLMNEAQLRQSAQQSWQGLAKALGSADMASPDQQLDTILPETVSALLNLRSTKKATQEALRVVQPCLNRVHRGEALAWTEWVRFAKLTPAKEGRHWVAPLKALGEQVLSHPGLHEDLQTLIHGIFDCATQALDLYQDYKRRHGLVDFIDQENLILSMMEQHADFREAIHARVQQILVDEFQDTSPIQLALFLALDNRVGRSVWVGDPKQAIYGFRGADYPLMDQITTQVRQTQSLTTSWRSRARLVDFCNAVFTRVFHERSAEDISLDLPPGKDAEGGWLEAWHLHGRSGDEANRALVKGIVQLLEQRPELQPGDLAVLCFQNRHCQSVAAALEAAGIPASAQQGRLMEATECRLALAALRYWQDVGDTLALAEIVALSRQHPANASWLEALITDDARALDHWRRDPLIQALEDSRSRWAVKASPTDALLMAMEAIHLIPTVQAWHRPLRRMANLDALRGCCLAYEARCRLYHRPATLAGLIRHLQRDETRQPPLQGDQSVQVITYHGAKGLEWPVVILTDLDREISGSGFGVSMAASTELDLNHPLADRTIHYWPWPFGTQQRFAPLEQRLSSQPEHREAIDRAGDEARRLLYVGMTRARDGMILALRRQVCKSSSKLNTRWLDELVDEKGIAVLDLDLEPGEQPVTIGNTPIPINVKHLI